MVCTLALASLKAAFISRGLALLSDPIPCFLIRVLHGLPTQAYSVSARGYQEPVRLPGACTRALRRLNPTFAPLPLETAL